MSENIKKAIDNFEEEDFVSAKDRIKDEIKGKTNDFFKEKLGLKDDIEPKSSPDNKGDAEEQE